VGRTHETMKNARSAAAPPGGTAHIALAGNPNVGKSTVFNALTGMHQHTGNWAGKTVECAVGECRTANRTLKIADLPGTYSLLTRSAEEAAAAEYLLQNEIDLTVVVCDATAPERNLNLVMQIMELSPRTLLCLNLMDEAAARRIRIDTEALSARLGIPVVGISARRARDIRRLREAICAALDAPGQSPYTPPYPDDLAEAHARLTAALPHLPPRTAAWTAMRMLDGTIPSDGLPAGAAEIPETFRGAHPGEEVSDIIVTSLVREAEEICAACVQMPRAADARERALDRIFTGRVLAFPLMLVMLFCLFWLTVTVSDAPSAALSAWLTSLEAPLYALLSRMGLPVFLREMLVQGMYRVLAWVVSVMLPPMAVFFPLFTLLEDAGFLPRIAYNLDRCFRCCNTCGKQALTMCMGFGCNAVGAVGCRIIDSPRERIIAMLTNAFIPCSGRFPLLAATVSMFLVGASGNAAIGALMLSAAVVIAVAVTLAVSALLSKTLLRGIPSSFTLELPPYRRPKVISVLVRSVLDRTVFVLGRAAAVAAPAGIVIWLLANVEAGGIPLLSHLSAALDPVGRFLGMDGVILLAFILGFPAAETVIPIMLMGYLSLGTLTEYESLSALRTVLTDNGWTPLTAVCVILFALMHWPCSTTLWTIFKETHSLRWTALALIIPTACGVLTCAMTAAIFG